MGTTGVDGFTGNPGLLTEAAYPYPSIRGGIIASTPVPLTDQKADTIDIYCLHGHASPSSDRSTCGPGLAYP